VFVAVFPASPVLSFVVGVAVDSESLPQFAFELSLVLIPVAVDDNSVDKLAVFPNSFEDSTTEDGKFAFAVFFVVAPCAYVLSVCTFEGSEPFLDVVVPLPFVVIVFGVVVFSMTLLVAIHPLAFINHVLSVASNQWLS